MAVCFRVSAGAFGAVVYSGICDEASSETARGPTFGGSEPGGREMMQANI